jgi:hypothetical protein
MLMSKILKGSEPCAVKTTAESSSKAAVIMFRVRLAGG